MKIMVISLGGSLIVPEKVDFEFLKKFRATLRKHYKGWKFVIVCGGGSIARKYINLLKKDNASEKEMSLAGIRVTRLNALLMMELFGKEANDKLPKDMKDVKDNLHKNKVVICGALRYAPQSTSDGTAARLANYLKCDFINMTNVKGLYSANPKTNKNAKFIPWESWSDFEKRANAIKYHSGQHFVLDQKAATMIRKHKTKTYIIGADTKNIDKILRGEPFTGTLICG
ncbi:MAG: UMP kinase [Candidatus Pacearchaeota archaeon]